MDRVAELYVEELVDESVVRGFGLAEADAERAGSRIIELYKATSNNDERERVLLLWSVVRPASDTIRRKLIDQVYIPMLGQGKQATLIALRQFDLVRDPPSGAARERIKQAVRTSAYGDKELEKRADKILKDAGWIKRRWFSALRP